MFTSDLLHHHLMRNHNVTMCDYRKEHLTTSGKPKKNRCSTSKKFAKKEESDSYIAEEETSSDVISIKQGEPERTEQGITKCGVVATESLDADGCNTKVLDLDDSQDQRIFTDYPWKMCRLKCNICMDHVKILRAHVQKMHDMSFIKFREMYPEEVYALKTYHRYR